MVPSRPPLEARGKRCLGLFTSPTIENTTVLIPIGGSSRPTELLTALGPAPLPGVPVGPTELARELLTLAGTVPIEPAVPRKPTRIIISPSRLGLELTVTVSC